MSKVNINIFSFWVLRARVLMVYLDFIVFCLDLLPFVEFHSIRQFNEIWARFANGFPLILSFCDPEVMKFIHFSFLNCSQNQIILKKNL